MKGAGVCQDSLGVLLQRKALGRERHSTHPMATINLLGDTGPLCTLSGLQVSHLIISRHENGYNPRRDPSGVI